MPAGCTLLAVVGESPQVLTETAWALAEEGRTLARVVVLATAVGAANVRAKLLGVPGQTGSRGPLDGPAVADRWSPFCHDVLGLDAPLPLDLRIPHLDGVPLRDVATPAHDRAFADLAYATVAELTAPGALPLVGSLAGGRKTMAAHVMTAFSVFARPEDALTHVLVFPPSFEHGDFYYPAPEQRAEVRVDLVRPPFPRLRALVAPYLGEGRDLRAVLDALDPLATAERPVTRLHLHLGERPTLRALGPDDAPVGDTLALAPAEAAVLLALADASHAGASVPVADLVDGGRLSRSRCAFLASYTGLDAPAWPDATTASKRVSDLVRRLRTVPVLARHAVIPPRGRADAYAVRLPPLRITSDRAFRGWPSWFPALPHPIRP